MVVQTPAEWKFKANIDYRNATFEGQRYGQIFTQFVWVKNGKKMIIFKNFSLSLKVTKLIIVYIASVFLIN